MERLTLMASISERLCPPRADQIEQGVPESITAFYLETNRFELEP
jgi:hypothetical protein